MSTMRHLRFSWRMHNTGAPSQICPQFHARSFIGVSLWPILPWISGAPKIYGSRCDVDIKLWYSGQAQKLGARHWGASRRKRSCARRKRKESARVRYPQLWCGSSSQTKRASTSTAFPQRRPSLYLFFITPIKTTTQGKEKKRTKEDLLHLVLLSLSPLDFFHLRTLYPYIFFCF